MIDWITILLALGITGALVGIFGLMAWKMTMSDSLSSDLLAKKDENHGLTDSTHSKKKKDKSGNDGKKKRKDAKKSKSNNRNDDDDRHSVTFKEPTPVPSDESDNDQDESEQGSITPPVPSVRIAPESLALSKRQKKKNRQTHSPSRVTGRVEGILINRDERSPVTDHPEPIPHPKLATMIPKDEVELAKLHHGSHQTKSNQSATKQTPSAEKPAATNDTPRLQHQEQPFTTVVNNRHKSGAPSVQQQQNRTKPIVAAAVPVPPPPAPAPAPAPAPLVPVPPPVVQQEVLPQRQAFRSQTEVPPTKVNGFNSNVVNNRQSASSNAGTAARPPPMKIIDMFKALPTSQAVVTELMLALDAYPLSADELNIVMHKIANKQSVVNKDWTKLQQGQKVDPQAHMGQMIDESTKACEEDLRTNARKQLKDLGDELNIEKCRIHDLLREKDEKEKMIELLRNQQQHQFQSLTVQIQRLTDENLQLNKRLSQQQQQPMNTNDATNAHLRLLQEQIEKVSIINGDYEKKIKANESLIEKNQKEKDELIRSNQKLTQRAQQHQQNEEKLVKDLNEQRTLHLSQINDLKTRLEQFELKAAATPNFDEQIEEQKKKFDDLQNRFNEQENFFKQEIDRLKQEKIDESNQQNESLAALRLQLDEAKTQSISIEQERNKFKSYLVDLLPDDVRTNLPDGQNNDDQWLSSYRQIFETQQRKISEDSVVLKQENDQLHQKMKEIETELKQIERTVQAKEETLLNELRERDGTLSSIQQENERLRHEVQRLQTDHDSATNEIRSLKDLLEGRVQLVNQHSPSTVPANAFDVNESNASSSDHQHHEQHQSES